MSKQIQLDVTASVYRKGVLDLGGLALRVCVRRGSRCFHVKIWSRRLGVLAFTSNTGWTIGWARCTARPAGHVSEWEMGQIGLRELRLFIQEQNITRSIKIQPTQICTQPTILQRPKAEQAGPDEQRPLEVHDI